MILRPLLLLGVLWNRGRDDPMHKMEAGTTNTSRIGARSRRLRSQSKTTQEKPHELDTSRSIPSPSPSSQIQRQDTSQEGSARQSGSSLHSNKLSFKLRELDSNSPNFRTLPIISTIFIPFALFLAIPGITEEWYIQTNDQHQIIQSEENPVYLEAILIISLVCAVLANICIIVRQFEKFVQKMTIICILALSVHDVINIVVIVMFIVKTQKDDGFILGQAFWMTVCSSIASMVTNITLVVDLIRTRDVDRDGSGLTRKQRSLANIIIVLLCYIAFGAAVHTALLDLSYIDALYYTVVCIETIGFGDISPTATNARVFTCVYTIFGNFFLAIAIGLIREALLEAIQINLRNTLQKARRQRIMHAWVEAIKWRLERSQLPVWVPVEDEEKVEGMDGNWPKEMRLGRGHYRKAWWPWANPFQKQVPAPYLETLETGITLVVDEHQGQEKRWSKKRRLNVHGLSRAGLQAAAMETGVPLEELLHAHPDDLDQHDVQEHNTYNAFRPGAGEAGSAPSPLLPTHHCLGKMVGLLGNFALAVSMPSNEDSDEMRMRGLASARSAERSPKMLNFKREEKKLFAIRVSAALALFLSFWMVGAGIFKVTEKWSFSLAVYFCFISFTTIGFGDPAPQTPAGRSFFVGWALLGVGTMTILISILADRSSEKYKKEMHDDGDEIEKAEIDADANTDMELTTETTVSTLPSNHHGDEHGLPNTPTPQRVPSSPERRRRHREEEVDKEKIENGDEEGKRPSTEYRREVLSRINKIETLVMEDEVYAAEDGRLSVSLAELLESELQLMLGLVKRSKLKVQNTRSGRSEDGDADDVES